MKDVEKRIDALIEKEKERDQKRKEERKRKEEHEKARREEEQSRIDNMYLDVAARVTDTHVEKDPEKMKRKERELLDAIIDAFKAGYRDARNNEEDKDRDDMMLDNLIHSIPQLSNEQLKYMKKTYENKKNKIVVEKLMRDEKPSPQEVKVLEAYRTIEKEIERRRQAEMMHQVGVGQDKGNTKKKGQMKR